NAAQTIAELAPLFRAVPKRTVKCRTVAQALHNQSWVSDTTGALSVRILTKYLRPDVPDQHKWKLSQSGSYSSRSACTAFFEGTVKFGPWRRIWRTWAPMQCKLFMWLMVNNRCWTADHLAKRGLPHPEVCPLCDQAETINHIIFPCVFSKQVWTFILQSLGLVSIIPIAANGHFTSWWAQSSKRVPKEMRKGLNSLGQNSCVFEGSQPNIQRILLSVRAEGLFGVWLVLTIFRSFLVGRIVRQQPRLRSSWASVLGLCKRFSSGVITGLGYVNSP
ncbi:hypothetical protein U9M48_039148, partial [Paspalum notatum var. saurae]